VPGWALESVTLNGQDLVDRPFEVTEDVRDLVVTLTDRPAEIRGTASQSNGAPDRDALVIAFPADPLRWLDFGRAPQRFRTMRPDSAGRFALTAVPPGDYFVAAISEAAAGDWMNPAFLENVSRQAARVHVDVGTTLTQALTTKAVK
jgi:hypothetical protein